MKPYIHAKASVQKIGHGDIYDYLPIHNTMDLSKMAWARASHRLVMHNTYGCYVIEEIYGDVAQSIHEKDYSPRDVAEMHCLEDMQHIHTVQRWCSEISEDLLFNRHRIIPSHEMADHTHKVLGGDWQRHFNAHQLIDNPYFAWADRRSRATMHHTTGVLIALKAFPDMYEVLMEHLRYEMQCLPGLADWLSDVRTRPWMGPSKQQSQRMKEFA